MKRIKQASGVKPTPVTVIVFPTVVGPRYARDGAIDGGATATEAWTANPYLREGERPRSTFALRAKLSTGMPLAGLRCDTHDISVDWTSLPVASTRR